MEIDGVLRPCLKKFLTFFLILPSIYCLDFNITTLEISGEVDPLMLDIKMDKKGLMSSEEQVKKGNRSSTGLTLTACKDLSHKHPVSGLLELSTKRKWGPPQFVQIFDCGPAHKKQYIFKVVVNGQDFQPTVASDNKKKAKADAATAALQQLGLLPIDPNNPL